jgi:ferredoxin-NADP reductase
MAVPGSTTGQGSTASGSTSAVARHHGFHSVRVARMVPETADASSLVLDVSDELRDDFAYEAGQFCTFRLVVDGEPLLRCYSMSSTPVVDDEFRVTVKRVPGGAVSNWLLDRVDVGDLLDVTPPAGVFTMAPDESELVAFAGGSGITPVFSLLKAALASTTRPVRLLYANRDADSVIFDGELAALVARVRPVVAELDEQAAQQVGLAGVIAHGMLSMAFLGQFVNRHIADIPGARMEHLKVRFLNMVRLGDTLTCQGKVNARTTREDLSQSITIECWAQNQKGDKVTTGEAAVIIPAVS